MNRPLMALAGLVVAGGIAGGVIVVASSGSEEEIAQQVQTGTPAASEPAPTTTRAATTAPSSDLAPPSDGYVWFSPDDFSPLRYAVQIPQGWGQRGSDDNRKHFVPSQAPTNFPAPDLPRLTIVAYQTTSIQPLNHAAPLAVGEQMPGGGCRGDIHDGTAQPSATQTIGSRQWEYFEFTCSISGARPVNYGGQAWETHLSDAVVAIVFIQSPDAAFDSTILKQARDTLELR